MDKKNALDENTVLLYQDETHIRAYQSLRATWSQSGIQKQVPTYGHHAYVTVFGTVQVGTGKIVTSIASEGKKEQFLAFLQLLLEEYKGKFIILVIDGAPIHRSQLVQTFLEEHKEELMPFRLPPYSPDLNPIERLWKWLKEQVIANKFHPTKSSIEEAVTSFLTEVSATPAAVLQRLGIH
ncbi:IS630 family transposase [Ectobacillus antri]|uniref:IS630 family transposase n=3 Tax=Ectobacillus antri TaxID=2486280 RepID=A0ABT6H8S1_9BACI|nr:IS630 family transposase [Ectobacillus antri]MDG5755679.1 IS630 family transposase [Ectobacillus antri]